MAVERRTAVAVLYGAVLGTLVALDPSRWPVATLVAAGAITLTVLRHRHRLRLAAAVCVATAAYGFGAAWPWSVEIAAAAGLLLLAAALVQPAPLVWLAGIGMAALSVGGMAIVLLRNQLPAASAHLGALATAWALGAGLFLVLRPAATLPLRTTPPAALSGLLPPSDRYGDWHGAALVALGAALAVGEGPSFAAAGLLLVFVLLRRHSIPWRVVHHPTVRRVGWAGALWLTAGIVAVGIGGEGLLRARELGRLGPLLIAPVVLFSASSVESRWLRRAAAAFVIVLAASSLVAIAQYSLDLPLRSALMRLLGHFSAEKQTFVPGHAGQTVAGGFYMHRLKLAHVLLVGLGLLAGRQLFAIMPRVRRLVEGGLLALFVVTLLLTFTRAALLGLAAGALACVVVLPGRLRWPTLGALAAAGLLALSLPVVRQRVISMGTVRASSDRAVIWSKGVQILADHRFGAGLANYPSLTERYYARVDPKRIIPRTYGHNLVLSTWVASGPWGAAAYIIAWLTLIGACGITLRRKPGPSPLVTSAAAAGLFGFVALWTVGLTHDVLYHKPVALTFAALVGAVLACLAAPPQAAAKHPTY